MATPIHPTDLSWVCAIHGRVPSGDCQGCDDETERAERDQDRAVLEQIRKLVHSPEAEERRNDACRHVVSQPYADNRYVRLLDDIREALRA